MQALGNYAWHWVHPHMYTPSLWEQGIVIRMSGSALELNKGWHPSSVKIICELFHLGVTHWSGIGELHVALGSTSHKYICDVSSMP